MKTFKRILSTALSAVLTINFVAPITMTTVAFAQEKTEDDLYDTLKRGFAEFNTVIDIEEYGFTDKEFAKLNSIINDVITDPELFYLNVKGMRCGAYEDMAGTVHLSTVKVEYQNTKEEVEPLIEQFNSKVSKIISSTVNDGMTDLEKALKLHDYIVLNTKYDLEGTMEDYNGGISAYDIIIMGNGVCQGYAQAYNYLLEKVGIESIMVTSQEMVHAWNLVNIDDQWYHVDATWDDPVPDAVGRVNHTYFMLSDEAISSTNDVRKKAHYSWDSKGLKATDTKYDEEFWQSVSTEIFMYDGSWYFISESGDYSTYSAASESVSANVSLEGEKWYVWESTNEFWTGKYTSLIISGGTVYFNTPTMIYSMNLDGSCKEAMQYVNPYITNGYVYGLVLKDDILYAVIKQAPTDDGWLYEVMKLQLDSYSYVETLLKSIEDMEEGQTSTFDMAEEKVLPAQAIGLIKGRDIELVLELDKYSWAINGQNVSASEPADINLEINRNEGSIPQEVIDIFSEENDVVELNLAHDGEFGFKANISYDIGSEFSERVATVYHYNEAENRMDKVQDTVIDESGVVTLSLDHASSYAVVMENIKVDDGDLKDPISTTIPTQTEPPTTTTVSSGSSTTTTVPTDTITSTTAITPQELPGIGDINVDGQVDLTDLTKLSLHLIGDAIIPKVMLPYADVTYDGNVDVGDLSTMKQYVTKDIESFTVRR